MKFNTECLPDVINKIESDRERIRLKKIIYGLTNKVWENDPKVVGSCSTYTLLVNLVKVQPEIKRLVSDMYNLIESLNRKEAYVPIAKNLLDIIAPIYGITSDSISQSLLENLLDEKEEEQKRQRKTCLNLLEVVVKDEIYNELQKLPVNVAKFVSIAEVASYTLNRLPPMYVASEEGKAFQMQRVEQMRGEIRTAVLRGIGAIMRDPLKKSTPLNIDEIDSFSTAHSILIELEEFARNIGVAQDKVSLDELSSKIRRGVRDYHAALLDLEQVLDVYGIAYEKITAKNLASVVRKILRQIEKNQRDGRHTTHTDNDATYLQRRRQESLDAQQTSIIEFTDNDQDNGDETFADSIRDWYSF
ncbi:sll1739 [Synechocystis sp. PCC 6803]|uniref:Sll1739 protein n=1 Tax=Synechocystis sp. (strain ATCC 27184 / PCC 6803 / Kazusa) TaxID=1111708 RepID=P73385_SYNY3|nr:MULTISPECIES: late competence development ComFB family protein [unclassified Synechocystis]BAM51153.1 hypothetical protein BEST7613_2222 [Synechocystis sp. PCC 6803] [Bacillus subtilis BEST7613]AGF51114.1 hypothetical protein MYO_18570 [Synechocystis sp. PCC 6803]ALJ67142.1 hypothetical protein AOY38_04375 [Synechocystis sp. PCC 6803]AVP88982.1 hypothetical protein C7I86_04380 [Synechocystis sp. IPPAS B-1465]MBD2618654.1 late competence development ComFB family protein [Synechocystis sp. FA